MQIGHALRYFSQFVVGFGIGFTSVWKLTLLTLAIVPLVAIAGGAYTIIMSTLSEKGEAAYAQAGKTAEEVNKQFSYFTKLFAWKPLLQSFFLPFPQVIAQIRTVYAYVGESKAVEKYSESLQNAFKHGKRSGFAKGIGVGFTYSLLFCAWALLLWYASLLVLRHETNGGKAFTTIINVIFSGL